LSVHAVRVSPLLKVRLPFRLFRKETGGSALNSSWFVEIIARLLRPKPRQLISALSNLHNSNPFRSLNEMTVPLVFVTPMWNLTR
ncbi:MAG TPA: hypothetical protein PLC23_15640, partial [Verrucomicrobiota bacterium]|nr:hypothetical protein [Verrucomicrobiota bacterium]